LFIRAIVVAFIALFLWCAFKIYSDFRLSSRKCVKVSVSSLFFTTWNFALKLIVIKLQSVKTASLSHFDVKPGCDLLILTHTLLENHTTDVHDYNEREQLKDKTKVTMVIYLDYNVKRLQLTKERLKTLRLHCGKT